MLQQSLEKETLHYLQPCSVPRSSLKNSSCHLPMGTGAKVNAMQSAIISTGQQAQAAWQLLQTAFHGLLAAPQAVM